MAEWKWDRRATAVATGIAIVAVLASVWQRLGAAAQFLVTAILVGVTWKYVLLTRDLVTTQREAVERETRERHRVQSLMDVNAVLHILDSYLIPHFIMWTDKGGQANVIRARTRDYFESRIRKLAEHTAGIAVHGPLLRSESARDTASIITRDLTDLIYRARSVDEAFAQALEATDQNLTTYGEVGHVYDEGLVQHDRKFNRLLSVSDLSGFRARVADLQGQLLEMASEG